MPAAQDLTINSFEINLANEGIANVAVYFNVGSFAGFDNNAAPWTIVGTQEA